MDISYIQKNKSEFQSFDMLSSIFSTKEEKTKLEKQIDDAYGKNDKKKLETLITKYVNEFPNNADYLNRLGVLYTNQKNYSEAEKWYLKAIEKGNFTAISNIAYLYFEKMFWI